MKIHPNDPAEIPAAQSNPDPCWWLVFIFRAAPLCWGDRPLVPQQEHLGDVTSVEAKTPHASKSSNPVIPCTVGMRPAMLSGEMQRALLILQAPVWLCLRGGTWKDRHMALGGRQQCLGFL